ncbi:MAG: hypothetical protein ACRDMA_12985 [Solirubrobacterales bacterium]
MTALSLRSSGRLGFSTRRRRSQSTASPEAPDQISSLAFWYDASASPTIESGGVIERWDDLSGNGHHAGQAVNDARPIKMTDAADRDVIRFDGADDILSVASPPDLAAGFGLFVVFAVRTRSDFTGILSAAAATGVDHEAFFTLQNASAVSQQFQCLAHSASADPLLIQRGDSGTIGLAILSAGGGNAIFQDLAGEAADTYEGMFATPAQIVLAGHYNDGTFGYAAVDFYEVGLYARALTPGERTALYNYLQGKYEL